MHSLITSNLHNFQEINKLKIIQHNVLKWTSIRANELTNYYLNNDPDIILLNSTGNLNSNQIRILNYNINYKNSYNEDKAGIAIAIKKSINYKLLEIPEEDMLAIEVNTTKGAIIIASMYQPPKRLHTYQ